MPELDLFTVLVAITSPAVGDTIFFLALGGFLDLIDRPCVSKLDLYIVWYRVNVRWCYGKVIAYVLQNVKHAI